MPSAMGDGFGGHPYGSDAGIARDASVLPERCSAGFSRRAKLCAVFTRATWENACGKFPTMRPALGIVFLGQQTDIVAQGKQMLEEFFCLLTPSKQDEVVRVARSCRPGKRLRGPQAHPAWRACHSAAPDHLS